MPKPRFQPPKGTRDLYPLEAARRRWLTERWRKVSIRHGFDEIDGPTFEPSDLYAVKSGEGILNELFQAFSGKDPAEVAAVQEKGQAPYALRPEFTPTLARMYAAQANSLPKPTKWFMTGPFFRAERPQRGRLREFLQWNADVLGDGSAQADADVLACLIDFFDSCGLTPETCRVNLSHRVVINVVLDELGVEDEDRPAIFALLDAKNKLSAEEFAWRAGEAGLTRTGVQQIVELIDNTRGHGWGRALNAFLGEEDSAYENHPELDRFFTTLEALEPLGMERWWSVDLSIVRGLAYYTGTVFEVIAEGERAVAGGGRYDNLVELFGGQKTPAVGFGMGDVVLTNLLQDKGLMPSDKQLLEEIGARPDAFLITPNQDLDAELTTLLSALRRHGLHARRTTKTTNKIGKLLKEADTLHARYAIILEAPGLCTIKNLDTADEHKNISTQDIPTHCQP